MQGTVYLYDVAVKLQFVLYYLAHYIYNIKSNTYKGISKDILVQEI